MSSGDRFPESGDADSASLAGQVSLAIRTGLPLESGLRALAEQTRSRRTRKALLELSQRLEQGTPLVDAVKGCDTGLPRSMRALVGAGMEAGRLDAVMQYSIEQSQRTISLQQQIWLALSYPIFLIWFSVLICASVLLFIVPVFSKIFDDFGTELPFVTLFVVRAAAFMRIFGTWSWLVFLIGGIGIGVIVLLAAFSKLGQRWSTSVPLVGRVFRFAALTDFCRVLAILVESGLPFPKSLHFAGNASDDRWLVRQCRLMKSEIEDGSTPELAAQIAELPNTLAQVLRSANSERALAEALRGLSDIYATQCFVASKLVSTVMAPFAVTIVIGFVGMTAIALFMPLIKLLNDLS